MPSNKVTRKRVNDPIIDEALRDIYNKLDALQPREPRDNYRGHPDLGTVTTVLNSDAETQSAVWTEHGWLVDINSNYQRIGTRGFIAAEGVHGRSHKPIKKEAISYDKSGKIRIGSQSGERNKDLILKNIGGTLKIRDSQDSGDADIQCANIKDNAGLQALEVSGKSNAQHHFVVENAGAGAGPALSIGNKAGVVTTNVDLNIKPKGSGTTNIVSDLNVNTIAEVGSDTDKFLMSDSGTVKYVTGANLLSYIGGAAAGTFLTNDAADIMAVSDFGANAALKIDADQPATVGAEDSVGLWIDYDRIVAGSGTAAHNDIGIDLDVNSASLGVSSVKGIDIDVVGATSGTHTATGIDLNVSGADTNEGLVITNADGGTDIKLVSSADSADFCTISTTANGATTITTVDAAATSSHLLLDIDGDITLDAHGKNIFMGYNGTNTWEFDLNTTTMKIMDGTDTGDYCSLQVGTHAATTLTTVDDDATAAHLTLDVDGDIIFDSHRGVFKFYDAGDDDDYFHISVVGGTGATAITTVSDNADGHITMTPDGHLEFGSGVGFDLRTPTYNASITPVDFRTGNKQLVTFGAGNITNLNLTFPATSGNFVLLLKQDGTGSRTITNYKVYASDEAYASGSAAAKFAGGSNPTLTTDANHVDILSFFWDADNEIAYGVATLDFQF